MIDIISRYHQEIQHSPARALILPTFRNLNIFPHTLLHLKKKNPNPKRLKEKIQT